MVLLRLYNTPGTWLSGQGPESDIVISSRLRLARNIEGFPFVNRMEQTAKQEFVEHFLGQSGQIMSEYNLEWIDMSGLSGLDRHMLFERHLISREIVEAEGMRGILVNDEESIAIMINEEDHLRIQFLASGLQLVKLWEKIDTIDDQIEQQVNYAFSPELGYLTSCPTNAGTGLRVSVMLHLPGLSITNQIKKVFQAVSKIGLTVRGLYGEGTEGIGDFYQVSNQVTLGTSETDIITRVGSIIPKVISYERKAREGLLAERASITEDRIWRAYGILKYAHSLSSEETLTLLSLLRLGVNLGMIKELSISEINNLFIYSQPSHLQKREQREMESSERDAKRASYLRNKLNRN